MTDMDDFLLAECGYAELADEILHFVNSCEIRKGEFEANMYVIEKLDSENLIIYQDLTDQSGFRHVSGAWYVSRKDLQDAMVKYAKKRGYQLRQAYLR